MATVTNDWKDLTAQNIYDILIELHFSHEMALRMKNEMSNGLLSFIASTDFNLLKKNNVYKLNTILTLMKHITNTQKFNSISFNYIGTDYDNLFVETETPLKPEPAPIKVHLEDKTKEFDQKKKAVKRKAFQELSNNVPEKQVIFKGNLQQLNEFYTAKKKMRRSSSDSSLASLSSTPDKPHLSKINQDDLVATKSNQYNDENRSNLKLLKDKNSLALNYIVRMRQAQQMRTEYEHNSKALQHKEPEHYNNENQSISNVVSFQQYQNSKLTQSGLFKTEPEQIDKQTKELKEAELTRQEFKNQDQENAESDTSIEPETRYLSEEGLIPLPEFSFQVQQILNDKNQCLKNLKLIAKETIDYYTENNFIINSKDYRRIAQALLNKYHILNYMVIKQVDLDYIRLRSRVRANPWTLISKHLSAEFRKLKSSQRKIQAKTGSDEIHLQTSDTESF